MSAAGVRVRSAPDDCGLTSTPCDRCATGAVWFDADDCQMDGTECPGCGLLLCQGCFDDAEARRWRWIDCDKQGADYCPACVARAPPHDEATCSKCAERKRVCAAARERLAAERRAHRETQDRNVWPAMLACVRGVSDKRARVVAAAYPSAARLVTACEDARKRGINDVDLLADLAMPDGKRLGRAPALAIHHALFDDFTA